MTKKIILLILILGFFSAGGLIFWMINLKLPDFQSLNSRLTTESTKIYDRTGEILLYNASDNVRRRLIPTDEISKHLKNATVAIEDNEFYEHSGIKVGAMFRALLVDIGSGSIKQGGSTITQQLIKNSLLTQEQKITRKIKEIFLALKLERVMSKEEILGWYLNETPYGGDLYGVEEASQTFFGHSASEVSLAEAAYLAAIPKAPTFYSPYGKNREALETRKNVVLERMLQLEFITSAEHDLAQKEKITFQPSISGGIKAPHFVMWVLSYLDEKYGREMVRRRGLKVITTLDWPMQQAAEAAVTAFGKANEENFNAKNESIVATDPKTGQVLALVGSRDYFDTANGGNFNVALAHRQPGSAFKPFVYATAFNEGYTPETMLFDLPTQFDTVCKTDPARCYTPTNYDNKYRGPMSLRQALAQSINIPSIKTLYLAGLNDSIATAERMGISSLNDPARYGLTLVLGGGEVSLLEMTNAYGGFGNDGVMNPPEKILKIEDSQGQTLEQFALRSRRAIPAQSARLISNILSDDVARTPIFGAHSLLYFANRDVAVKTGTTNDYRDAWIIGYTPNLAVGAWAGNNDNSPMARKISGLIITPLWRQFFDKAAAKLPAEKFIPPEPTSTELPPVYRGFWEGGQSYYLDQISGKLATEYTPSNLRQEKVIKQVHSILFWLNRQNDSQFFLWEEPIRWWVAQNGIAEETEQVIPTVMDDVHRPEFAPQVSFLSPLPQTIYQADDRVAISLQIESVTTSRPNFPATRADFFLNNNLLGSRAAAPFTYTFNPKEFDEALKEKNELKAVVYDSVGNQTTVTTELVIEN